MSDATLPVVHVLNSPDLNFPGKREPHIYALETLADIERDVRALASELGLAIRFHRSKREYGSPGGSTRRGTSQQAS